MRLHKRIWRIGTVGHGSLPATAMVRVNWETIEHRDYCGSGETCYVSDEQYGTLIQLELLEPDDAVSRLGGLVR